jgi:hypothetical protein
MPGDRDDDDAPRWELPVWDPAADEVPRWEPEPLRRVSREPRRDVRPEVPRWQPDRGRPSAPRGGGVPSSRVRPTVTAIRRESPKPVSPLAAPFVWWGTHPWAVLWLLIILAPVDALLLRALDESSLARAVTPAVWGLVVLFVVALALAMVASAGRSANRLVLGTLGALAALGVLLWPVTRVTLGRGVCPARAGTDLGARVAAGALDAWLAGEGDAVWHGQPDEAWRERTRAASLVDYQLVATGCWERMAPIDATHTWHDFRVTVQEGGGTPLSKTVVVHTAVARDGWKITAIEGPVP